MLNRKEKSQFESPERLNLLVEGTKIIGDILSDSKLRIDGEVQGNIATTSAVVIGKNGVVHGNLNCQEAEIEGRIDGKLSVEGVLILRATANIVGDIQATRLVIEEGALFLGSCSMTHAGSKENTTSISPENRSKDLAD